MYSLQTLIKVRDKCLVWRVGPKKKVGEGVEFAGMDTYRLLQAARPAVYIYGSPGDRSLC